MSMFKSIKIKKCLKKIEPDVDKKLMKIGLVLLSLQAHSTLLLSS